MGCSKTCNAAFRYLAIWKDLVVKMASTKLKYHLHFLASGYLHFYALLILYLTENAFDSFFLSDTRFCKKYYKDPSVGKEENKWSIIPAWMFQPF